MPSTRSDLLAVLNRWPRRVLAGLCLLLAVASFAAGKAPANRPTAAPVEAQVSVVVAARDLPAGTALTAGDLRLARWPARLRPAGALSRLHGVTGRRLVGPIGRAEAVTITRLLGPGLTASLPDGLTAASVALPAGPAGTSAGLLAAGAEVDLLGTPTGVDGAGTGAPRELGRHLLVLAVTTADPTDPESETTLVLAVDPTTARRLAACATCAMLALRTKSP